MLTKQQIFYSSKLKEFADTSVKFDKNGGKFSKRVENTVRKGKMAHCEQFLLFAQCFQKTCTCLFLTQCFQKDSSSGVVWDRVNYKCYYIK